MLQHPVQIVLTGTGQPVRVIIAGIVIPESIIQRQDPLPIEGVEDVLVGEKHFFFMLRYIPENLLCGDGTSAFLQIHQQDAGVIVIVIGPQAEIDRQVVALVKKQHEKAAAILVENREKLDELDRYLYEKETITGEEFMEILNR